jgi:hypothetical protein
MALRPQPPTPQFFEPPPRWWVILWSRIRRVFHTQQGIKAGDDSQNIQAFGDVTVHHHATPPVRPSVIEKPTLEQIKIYDPETAKIIMRAREQVEKRAKEREKFSYEMRTYSTFVAGHLFILIALVIIAIAVFFYFNR